MTTILPLGATRLRNIVLPEVVSLFREYYQDNPAWGALHITLDDGNVYDDHILHCIRAAVRDEDWRGYVLGLILLRMSRTQRGKLSFIIDNEYPEFKKLTWDDFAVYYRRDTGRTTLLLNDEVDKLGLKARGDNGVLFWQVQTIDEALKTLDRYLSMAWFHLPIISAFRIRWVIQASWLVSKHIPDHGKLVVVTIIDNDGEERQITLPGVTQSPKIGDRLIVEDKGTLCWMDRKTFEELTVRLDGSYYLMKRNPRDHSVKMDHQLTLRNALEIKGVNIRHAEYLLRKRSLSE